MRKTIILLLVIIMLPAFSYSQELLQWGSQMNTGPTYDIYVATDTLVSVSGANVDFYNVTTTSFLTSNFRVRQPVNDILLDGKDLYFGGADSLVIYDITDLNNVTETAVINSPAMQIELAGDTLYVKTDNTNITVYDVATAASPVFKYTLTTTNTIESFLVSTGGTGDTLWVMRTDSIMVYDIMDNFTTTLELGAIGDPLVTTYYEGFKNDSVLFVGSDYGMHRINVSDPLIPDISATYAAGHGYHKVTAYGDTLYATDEWGNDHQFDQFDISGLGTLSIVDSFYVSDDNAWITEMKTFDNKLFLSAYGAGFYIYDISDPAVPSMSQNEVSGYSVGGIYANSGWVYAAKAFDGVIAMNYADSTLNAPVMYLPSPAVNYTAVVEVGGYVYAAYSDGIDVLDTSTLPGSLTKVGSVSGTGTISLLTGNDTTLFAAQTSGFKIFDIKNPMQITQLYDVTSAGNVKDFWLGRKILYLTSSGNGIKTYDISDLSVTPTETGSGYINAGARRITVDSDEQYAYLALLDGAAPDSIKVLDVSDIFSVSEIATFWTGDSVNFYWDMYSVDNYLVIGQNEGGFYTYDVSDPYNPAQVTFNQTYGNVLSLFAKGFRLFISDGYDGLHMYKFPYGFAEFSLDKMLDYHDQDTIRVDLHLNNDLNISYTDTSIYSFEYKMRFDTLLVDTIADAGGLAVIDTTGSALDNSGFTLAANVVNDTLIVTGASASPLDLGVWSGPVLFSSMLFKRTANAMINDTVNFNFEQFMINDGTPQVLSKNGKLKFKPRFGDISGNKQITSLDASLILQYIVGLITLPGDSVLKADVTGSSTITAFDASYIMRYAAGYVTGFPADQNYTFKSAVNGYGEAEVCYSYSYDQTAEKISLPVTIKEAGAVSSFEFEIKCADMKFSAVNIPESSGNMFVETSFDNGILKIAGASALPVTDDELVINIDFTAENDPGDTGFEFSKIILNEMEYRLDNLNGENLLPKIFQLHQNYPNPFNPVTTIKYDLPKNGRVELRIYNVLGQEVCTLFNGEQKAGFHMLKWNGTTNLNRTAASGVYFYRIVYKSGNAVQKVKTKKMLFIK